MHFEKDKALARRFQPVLVAEPSQVFGVVCYESQVVFQVNFSTIFKHTAGRCCEDIARSS
jgi:hypothetical protein